MRLIFNLRNIMRKYCSLSYHLKIGLLLLCFNLVATLVWQRTGCHIVGHSQKISIQGCVEFEITSNACRGFCTSYAVPSSEEILQKNKNQGVTSFAQCCSMVESQELNVRVMCVNGPRDLTFMSAVKCACAPCKKY